MESTAEVLCQKQEVPPGGGVLTCPPRAMLCKMPCEVTAQVTARWGDLDENLLVSAGIGVSRERLLDGTQSVLLPQGRKRH